MIRKLIAAALLLFPAAAFGEETLDQIFARVKSLNEQGKHYQAMTELAWANKQLEKQHMTKLQSFFPNTVGQWKGSDFDAGAALGFASVKRSYKNPANDEITVTLAGSAGGGAAGQGLGALANFAQMAAMMNPDGTTETLRIKGRAATFVKEGSPKITFPFGSGMLFDIEGGSDSVTKEQLVAVAEAIDTKGLEAYLTAPSE